MLIQYQNVTIQTRLEFTCTHHLHFIIITVYLSTLVYFAAEGAKTNRSIFDELLNSLLHVFSGEIENYTLVKQTFRY